jgi:DNA polymerase-1
MPRSRPVLYLVDASSYVYRAFFALPPLTSPAGLPTNAVFGFTTMLLKLLRETRPEYLGVIFDAPGPTFRDDLFEPYKAHRPATPDDLAAQLPVVHEVVEAFRLRALAVPGVEADDVIASLAATMSKAGADCVVITGDKDLMQIVDDHVRLWDTMRDRRVDAAAVRARFGVDPPQVVDVLGLMGDPIDNVPGVKGIGEKTAAALIGRFGDLEQLLARLDELEKAADIRAAKKLAATLREHAEVARLSRTLVTVRRDVPLDVTLDSFRYQGPDAAALRPLFSRLGFQTLLRELAATAPATTVVLREAVEVADVEALAATARQRGRVALACDGQWQPGHTVAAEVVLGVNDEPPLHVSFGAAPPLARPIAALLRDAEVEKVAHDLKHDLLLLGDGLPGPLTPAFDTMIASYLLEASATHRLEDLATDELGVNLPAFRDGTGNLANGVSLLPRLRERLAPRLAEAGMMRLFDDVEMPLVGVLAAMERRGVRIDVAALQRMSREMDGRLQALMEEIYALAGGEFNIGSPPQLREVLFDRLGLSRKGVRRGKTGLSTDVDVLTRLAAEHPLPAKILDYRGLAKLKSTYVDALPAAVSATTGRLHTSFNQTVAATGRLSSSEPNLQNIPVRGDEGRRIRAAFVTDPGWTLVVADYSQIELRVLAHLSEDPVLLEAFRSGADVHARTAAEVFGVLPAMITPEMRRVAKVINFGIIYGMGPQRLARELDIPLADAEQYIRNYFARYAGVRSFMTGVQADARRRGYVTTLLGRRRTLPDLASPHRGVAQAAERAAANTPIQGSAADLIKLAMVAIDRRIAREGLQAAMILQVHDELVFEVAENEREGLERAVREEMEGVFPLTVPLQVDMGWGQNWAEAH